MPWDALPDHINQPHNWNGKDDDDHWYTRWRKQVKGYFAFGPRSKHWWARFREWPITVFAMRGKGFFRLEDDTVAVPLESERLFCWWNPNEDGFYLSRVQYWTKWHIALQWPLFLHGHYGQWQGYIGFKRDADRVYWLSLYFGRTWK